MNPFRLFVVVAAFFCSSSFAFSVQEAQELYPSCALTCLIEYVPLSGCALTDSTCLCTNKPLNANISVCVMEGCDNYDKLRTKNASMTMCGGEVRDKSDHVIAVGVVPGVFALIVFILRMCASLTENSRPLGWEDWTMCVMVVLAAPPTAFAVVLAKHGLGKDMWTLSADDITSVLFYYYIGEIFYFAAITMNKISILCFILRIFPARPIRIASWVGIGLSIAYGLTFLLITAFQCNPIPLSWYVWDGKHPGKCNNIHMQAWMSAIWNIVIDIYILILPIRELSKLKMGIAKKLMLIFMFSLGFFVTMTSAIRLHTLIIFANSQNITWDYVDAAIWSTIELHLGIICASLPALRALFISLGAGILKSTSDKLSKPFGGSSPYNTPNASDAHERSASSAKILPSPKKGDERDFIRLDDLEHSSTCGLTTKEGSDKSTMDGYYQRSRGSIRCEVDIDIESTKGAVVHSRMV